MSGRELQVLQQRGACTVLELGQIDLHGLGEAVVDGGTAVGHRAQTRELHHDAGGAVGGRIGDVEVDAAIAGAAVTAAED
jgi:hypothetical protein